MALLNSGFSMDEPTEFTTPLEKLIRVGLGVARDAPIEEIEIELEQEKEATEEAENSSEPE